MATAKQSAKLLPRCSDYEEHKEPTEDGKGKGMQAKDMATEPQIVSLFFPTSPEQPEVLAALMDKAVIGNKGSNNPNASTTAFCSGF